MSTPSMVQTLWHIKARPVAHIKARPDQFIVSLNAHLPQEIFEELVDALHHRQADKENLAMEFQVLNAAAAGTAPQHIVQHAFLQQLVGAKSSEMS